MPLPPQVIGPGIINPDQQTALNREKIIAQAKGGLNSTIAAGMTASGSMPPPTVASKTLLGS